MNYKDKYDLWINSSFIDEDTKGELKNIKEEKEIEDRFYKDLEFGTGGLRGVIGAGSNRLNVYTVGKATEGFGRYLKDKFENPSVAIAHDSRNMSKEFAEYAGRVLAANGVKVYLFETLTPTPILSYGVRKLKCSGGIVITASHNPKEYNGYKVYGADGGQVTDIPAKEIIGFVNGVNSFEDVNVISKEEALENGMLNYVGEDVYSTYVEKVKDLTIRKELVHEHAKDLNIIYTPIHGTGNIPVRRVLKELGYENVRVVKEQELPNGNFPTAPYPNPEDKQVFTIALDMAKTEAADIILGTDPDCDRIGVVVKDNTGEYRVLNGNQVGVLLSHYMISSLKDENRLPNGATIVNTIVSTNMVNPICREYDVEVREVLTGFKYIGELIGKFEKEAPRNNSFLFGYEESYGYLAGDFVRDKDAVIAATLICEMTLYYKSLGKTLYEALIDLYDKYGYYKEKLISITLKGKEGQEKIASIIEALRNGTFKNFGEFKVVYKEDYKLSYKENVNTGDKEEITLPKSNVIKFIFDDEAYFVVRPSGTEPKIKIYLGVIGNSISDAENKIINLENEVNNLLKTI